MPLISTNAAAGNRDKVADACCYQRLQPQDTLLNQTVEHYHPELTAYQAGSE